MHLYKNQNTPQTFFTLIYIHFFNWNVKTSQIHACHGSAKQNPPYLNQWLLKVQN